jgi:PAS domain S-box-containing protein
LFKSEVVELLVDELDDSLDVSVGNGKRSELPSQGNPWRAKESQMGGRSRILIAEDQKITAKHLKSSLQGLGYEIVGAVSTGSDAIDRAEEAKPDLVLMDIRLQGDLDGIEAAQAIRERHNIPIVYVTAYSDQDVMERAKLTEPFGYLLKPFGVDELRTTIEMALYKHQMERRLRETEERMHLALAGANLGIWEVNIQSGEAFYDRRCNEIFGYQQEGMESSVSQWSKSVHPDDVHRIEAAFNAHARGETASFECEHRIRHKRGGWKWNLARGKLTDFDSNGNPLRMVGTSLDITKLKCAQEQLEHRVGELSAMNLLAKKVSTTLSRAEVLEASVESVMAIMAPTYAGIYVREGDWLLEQSTHSVRKDLLHVCPPKRRVGECLCGLAASGRESVYCLDIHKDPRCILQPCRMSGIQSFAALPLIARNEVLGVLGIASKDQRDFSTQSVFLETLADQISIGLRNALLHEEITVKASELQTSLNRAEQAEHALKKANEDLELRVLERTKELSIANDKLLKAKTEWEITFNAVPDLIAIVGNDYRIIRANKAFSDSLNLHPHQVDVMACYEAIHGCREPISNCPHRKLLSDGKPHSAEVIEPRLGCAFDVTVSPLFGENGDSIGSVHVARDITDRKEVESALRRSEERYRTLVEQLPATTYLTALDQHCTTEYLSPQVEGMLGWPLEDYGSDPHLWSKSLHPDDRERVLEEVARCHEGQEPLKSEYRIRTRDGQTRWIRDEAVVLRDTDGHPMALQGVRFDITDRKKTEELAICTARLQAVADLASGVAHHFNNMLQVVVGAASVATVNLEMGKLDNAKSWLDKIIKSARFGSETVKRLQSFVRVQSVELGAMEKLDLSDLARESIETTRMFWQLEPEEAGIEITVIPDLRIGCTVKGRANEVFEVITNLIRNAVEAMEHGGELRIESRVVGEWVLLHVSDTGEGIPAKDLTRIFEPFYTTKGYQRTGMGLASSYGIIARHGGTISVQSEEGVGSTFAIELPFVSRDLSKEEPPVPRMSGQHLRILAVDDVELGLMVIKDGLTALGQTVLTAVSWEEAIKLFEEGNIDFVLCDLGLQGMNGWEVGERIKSICHKRRIAKPPFVLVTGWGSQVGEKAKMLQSGVDAVVEKPVDIPRLWSVIIELASRQSVSIPETQNDNS